MINLTPQIHTSSEKHGIKVCLCKIVTLYYTIYLRSVKESIVAGGLSLFANVFVNVAVCVCMFVGKR